MTTPRHLARAALAAATACAACALLAAQDPAPKPKPREPAPQTDPLDELKQRMKSRYADLARLRDAGKIGETVGGEVALVDASHGSEKVDPAARDGRTIAQLVSSENTDRTQLYALLAKQLKTTAAEVAAQNGLRNFANAEPDHWLRLADGRWVQRKNVQPKDERGGDKKEDGRGGRKEKEKETERQTEKKKG